MESCMILYFIVFFSWTYYFSGRKTTAILMLMVSHSSSVAVLVSLQKLAHWNMTG